MKRIIEGKLQFGLLPGPITKDEPYIQVSGEQISLSPALRLFTNTKVRITIETLEPLSDENDGPETE